jgi:hypothetical protein
MMLDSTINLLQNSIDCNDYIRMAMMDTIQCSFRELHESHIYQRETSCFYTPEHQFLSLSSDDSPGSVDFNWEKIWDKIRGSNIKPSCAYMVHSHPPCCYKMSSIDGNMVQGWRMALGCPIWFIVLSANKNKYDPINSTVYYVDRINKKIDIKEKNPITYSIFLNVDYIIVSHLIMAISYIKNLSQEALDLVMHDLNATNIKLKL